MAAERAGEPVKNRGLARFLPCSGRSAAQAPEIGRFSDGVQDLFTAPAPRYIPTTPGYRRWGWHEAKTARRRPQNYSNKSGARDETKNANGITTTSRRGKSKC
jgi:hypothetical protein